MENTTKLLLLHFLSHIMIIPMFLFGELWMFISAFVWWQWIAATAITSGYHRYFSHRSFKADTWYDWYSQYLGIFSNAGPVLTWAAVHRMHHANSDNELDPHSPKYKGFWYTFINLWGYDVHIPRKFLKGLIENKRVRFFHKHYFLIVAITILILGLIDFRLLLFGFFFPVICGFWGFGSINAYTHRKGYAVNSALANVLTAGEGWHLNHHIDAGNWKIGKGYRQIDPGSWFIFCIKK